MALSGLAGSKLHSVRAGRVELVGQQPEARDVGRPAPAPALLRLRVEAVDHDLQRVSGRRALDMDRAADRIDPAEVQRRDVPDR